MDGIFLGWSSEYLGESMVIFIGDMMINHIYQWIGLRENLNRKPWFLPSNIGLSCKFSHHPVLWIYCCLCIFSRSIFLKFLRLDTGWTKPVSRFFWIDLETKWAGFPGWTSHFVGQNLFRTVCPQYWYMYIFIIMCICIHIYIYTCVII